MNEGRPNIVDLIKTEKSIFNTPSVASAPKTRSPFGAQELVQHSYHDSFCARWCVDHANTELKREVACLQDLH